MLGTVFTILILFLLILWIRWRKRKFSVFSDLGIPGPIPNIFTGNYHEIRKKGVIVCEKEWIQQYGKVLGYFRGGTPILLIADINLAKQILIKDFDKFTDRPPIFTATPIGHVSQLYSSRLISACGKKRWKEVRSIVTTAYTTSKMKLMFPLINNAIDTSMNAINEMSSSGKSFDINDIYGILLFDVACRTIAGMRRYTHNSSNREIYETIKRGIFLLFPDFFVFLYTCLPEFKKFWVYISKQILSLKTGRLPVEILCDFLRKLILIRKTPGKYYGKDVLQIMIDASIRRSDFSSDINSLRKSEHLKEGPKVLSPHHISQNAREEIQPITDNEIISNVSMFFSAALFAVRSSLCFATHILIRHPDIQQKIREEIWEYSGGEAYLGHNSIQKLTYLNKFMMEVLRMYPPLNGFVSRVANEDVQYGSYKIKKGMTIQVAVSYINRDPDIWQDANTFSPERFHNDNLNTSGFLTFGAGPKHCIGSRFALLEMKLTLARILSKYELIATEDTENEISINFHQFSMSPRDVVTLKIAAAEKS